MTKMNPNKFEKARAWQRHATRRCLRTGPCYVNDILPLKRMVQGCWRKNFETFRSSQLTMKCFVRMTLDWWTYSTRRNVLDDAFGAKGILLQPTILVRIVAFRDFVLLEPKQRR